MNKNTESPNKAEMPNSAGKAELPNGDAPVVPSGRPAKAEAKWPFPGESAAAFAKRTSEKGPDSVHQPTLSPFGWDVVSRIADMPAVDECLQGFSQDPTADNAVCLVRAVIEALNNDGTVDAEYPPATAGALELAAQAWCEPGTSHIPMIPRLAEAFGRILDRQRGAAVAQPMAIAVFPDELTPELRYILGVPNFRCAPYAEIYRIAGYAIPNKAEEEQAFVLHRMVRAALVHGDGWDKVIGAELEQAMAGAEARQQEGGAA